MIVWPASGGKALRAPLSPNEKCPLSRHANYSRALVRLRLRQSASAICSPMELAAAAATSGAAPTRRNLLLGALARSLAWLTHDAQSESANSPAEPTCRWPGRRPAFCALERERRSNMI